MNKHFLVGFYKQASLFAKTKLLAAKAKAVGVKAAIAGAVAMSPHAAKAGDAVDAARKLAPHAAQKIHPESQVGRLMNMAKDGIQLGGKPSAAKSVAGKATTGAVEKAHLRANLNTEGLNWDYGKLRGNVRPDDVSATLQAHKNLGITAGTKDGGNIALNYRKTF